ncbi:MAG: protein-L-isoaspartate(D-aspartate) O-methyltransferase [Candidatus Doudnabacteria bacterium]|nr:protein-L-isoaspartate(D-aspartate) O-methyltransferase [Candidatus Doudnabacteria bacterium]
MEKLVARLKDSGILKSPNIISGLLAADRKYFVPADLKEHAYEDSPLPIGQGQTISQPYTVAFMLELLSVTSGAKVLDVGFGSGWTTAILSFLVGNKGEVWALERDRSVYQFGQDNLARAGFSKKNIHLLNLSGWNGYDKAAPYDRILVSAAAGQVPPALMSQLRNRGRMIIPVWSGNEQEIRMIDKSATGEISEQRFPGFVFVPLVKE